MVEGLNDKKIMSFRYVRIQMIFLVNIDVTCYPLRFLFYKSGFCVNVVLPSMQVDIFIRKGEEMMS